MPTRIFDWIFRTAMMAMAGLVTLSILGAIAAMTSDPGTRFAAGDRPVIEAAPAPEQEQEREREAAQAQPSPGAGPDEANMAAAAQAGGQAATAAAAPAADDDEVARWLEAIAYALLALAGVGALGVLMLWSVVRELRRIGDRPVSR